MEQRTDGAKLRAYRATRRHSTLSAVLHLDHRGPALPTAILTKLELEPAPGWPAGVYVASESATTDRCR